ncbi:MAG: nitroreductase family protein [Candidatus Thermoplasmatota archaeon]|nr:nitroreductase family protein [Candidatus Thermoplasmatota archaeon]
MELDEIIEKRRAYRSLEEIEITDETIEELAETAQLSASCFNNQPWNFIFVDDEEMLEKMENVMMQGNEWTQKASLIVGVFSRVEDDCEVQEREYHLFDTGQASAYLQLKATEMGLVAHPIAGFDEGKAKDLLEIPEEYRLITLIIVGKHSESMNDLLSKDQIEIEKERPEREDLEEFVHRNKFA